MKRFVVFLGIESSSVSVFEIDDLLDELRIAEVLGAELTPEVRDEKLVYNLYEASTDHTRYIITAPPYKYTLMDKLRNSFELRNLVRIGRYNV